MIHICPSQGLKLDNYEFSVMVYTTFLYKMQLDSRMMIGWNKVEGIAYHCIALGLPPPFFTTINFIFDWLFSLAIFLVFSYMTNPFSQTFNISDPREVSNVRESTTNLKLC